MSPKAVLATQWRNRTVIGAQACLLALGGLATTASESGQDVGVLPVTQTPAVVVESKPASSG